MITDKISKNDLYEFLKSINEFRNIDINKIFEITIRHINCSRQNKYQDCEEQEFQDLQNRWYNSLKTAIPDYSVYDDDLYFADIWACWVIYSRKYLLGIKSEKSLATKDDHGNWYNFKSIVNYVGNIKTVADLGCGFGYTTIGLKEIFPYSAVYGTNLKNIQFSVAEKLSKKYDFNIVESINEIPSADLVFASEYFEHIPDPINHLHDVIKQLNPKYFLIANSFGADAIGHFNIYTYNNMPFHSSKIGRMFNDVLRYNGYEKVFTKLWNNRPSFWSKKSWEEQK